MNNINDITLPYVTLCYALCFATLGLHMIWFHYVTTRALH